MFRNIRCSWNLCGVALLLSVSLLQGCGFSNDDADAWKEEIRLMNGELLVLDRLNKWGDSGDLSLGHGPKIWAEMHWVYKGKQYDWGERGVSPHALQLDPQGRFYVVTSIPYCWAWRERGKPKSFYVVFRFEGNRWVEVPLDAIDVNAVFNLAGTSKPPNTNVKTLYQKETDWKYKDDRYDEYMRRIVVTKRPYCF